MTVRSSRRESRPKLPEQPPGFLARLSVSGRFEGSGGARLIDRRPRRICQICVHIRRADFERELALTHIWRNRSAEFMAKALDQSLIVTP